MNPVRGFEKEIESWFGVRHARAVNSGSSAIMASLLALGVGPGDRVIVPAYTFPSTANSVLHVGATPILIDVYPGSLTINIKEAEKAIEEYNASVIIPVHLFGRPCKIEELNKVKTKYDIIIVEDACQAIGSEVNGKFLGTIFDAGVLSFYFSKNLWTYEGGMVLTDDADVADKISLLRNHGFNSDGDMILLGHNWKMPQILAFLGTGMAKHHKIAILSELGRYSPEDGYYPKVVYQHSWYQDNKDKWIALKCPIAEETAKKVSEAVEWRRK